MIVFDHIGYAVVSIERHLQDFLAPLFSPVAVGPVVEDPRQQVRVCFVTLPGGVVMELVEPMGNESPISRRLRERQGGLYHLCYRVDSLEEAMARFRARGCLPVSPPTPATAYEGRRVVFLFTPQQDLVELVEEGGVVAPT